MLPFPFDSFTMWSIMDAILSNYRFSTLLYRSNDDAFMIYLALWSGPNCYLFSNDEFRQHRFTLGPDASPLLARWQSARQISMRSAHPLTFLVSRSHLCHPLLHPPFIYSKGILIIRHCWLSFTLYMRIGD